MHRIPKGQIYWIYIPNLNVIGFTLLFSVNIKAKQNNGLCTNYITVSICGFFDAAHLVVPVSSITKHFARVFIYKYNYMIWLQ